MRSLRGTAIAGSFRRRALRCCHLRPQTRHEAYGSGRRQLRPAAPSTADSSGELRTRCISEATLVTRPSAKTQGDVNGPDTQPIWKYLKEHAEPPVDNIDWNFSKFLVKNGKITWFPAKSSKVVSSIYPSAGAGRADRQADVAAKL